MYLGKAAFMKKVELISDYTPLSEPNFIKILQDEDGDFHLSFIKMNDNESGIRVATSGTRYSPEVRKALSDLMKAIEKDNIERDLI